MAKPDMLSLQLLAERIAHQREVADLRHTLVVELEAARRGALEDALRVQTLYLERRLADLNGERERERERSASFLTREYYEESHRSLEAKFDRNQQVIIERFERDEATQNRWGGGLGAILATVAVTGTLFGIGLAVVKLLGV